MRITLEQLNQSFQSLGKLANYEGFKKDQAKLKYKISRIWKDAKREIQEMQTAIRELMETYGIQTGQPIANIPGDVWNEFQAKQKEFLSGIAVELWGDPFKLDEILDLECLTADDLANLDWLYIDQVSPEPEKASTGQI